MRRVLLLSLLAFNFISYGQSLRVGLVGQAGLNYYTAQSDGSGASQNFKLQHKPIVAYQAGFIAFKELNPEVTFVTGLVLAQRGVKSQYNTSNITAFNFSNSGYDLKLIDRYFEIPLLLNLHIIKKETVSFFASFGIKPSFYFNSVSKIVGSSSNYSRYYYSAHRRFNLFACIGAGANFKVSEKFDLVVWPSLEHAIISEVYASPLKLYPYSVGINLCLLYSLGN